MQARFNWEHFEHQADIGVRGIGRNPAEAFAAAAMALTAIITDPDKIRPSDRIEVECQEQDLELLLVDWLNRVIFEMATRHMLFSHFELSLQGDRLHASLFGEPLDRIRHAPAVEIKGATFTELAVRPREDGLWLAQCVVDV